MEWSMPCGRVTPHGHTGASTGPSRRRDAMSGGSVT
jgi:hypothetical protein